ncbi:VOC family protein [Modestobacter sp. KNN46-3]|jgi:catechol 2,3-dioxygenase-like lactoylglutathione lyase family enzyme|uniref:VOC family protein n=1 Tax=Modestobacter sp. KNN46-3 TaxID=2711218 RepID=UPI0013DFB4AE|nr:VOC family protein [Modestobacter sp. KNN46-3]
MLNTITITQIFVPDQDAALDFYVGKLGFEVRTDQQFGPMRFLTVALPSDPGHAVLLERPGPPGYSEEIAAQVRDLISKGAAGGHLFFSTDDAYKTHAELRERGVEIAEEPVVQPYGIDFGFRDPFGNHVRVAQLTPPPSA